MRIPLTVKVLYSLFLAVLIPYYWVQYTPVNFLWFCDVALLFTFFALWRENALLAGTQAVAITLPQLLWVVDFAIALATGVSVIGLSGYMLDGGIPLFVRGLSLFHGWLPFLLLWLVYRLGYDRRSLAIQSVLCGIVLVFSYLLTPGPFGPAENVNKVYGPNDKEPQTWMSPWLWVALLMAAYPICIYLPTHLVFCWLFRRPAEGKSHAIRA
jgi:hypothetical protein